MLGRAIGALALLLYPALSCAQGYPAKPIRIVVPFAPGGGTDILTRVIVPKTSELLKQQIVVDNRPGAGSQIGSELVAKAVPDGYTLLMVDTAFITNPSLYSRLPYDSARDFAPISLAASAPVIMVVHPSVPVRTVKELVALARARPGALNFASGGPGSSTHLGVELLKYVAKVQLVHIPYKGTGPAVSDVLGGQVTMMFAGISSVKGHAEAGSYWGALAPARTPPEAINRVNAVMAQVLKLPDIVQRLVDLGFVPIGSTPEHYARLLASETEKWAKVIRAANIRLD
jgi:tripartite-type tricarboxylate transporter receptor subunit TctC